MFKYTVFSFLVPFFFSFASFAQESKDNINPEIATEISAPSLAKGKDFMVVTADPDATRAAYDILESGGTAADAAIAAQLVLGLTEPQSSGLGGGAFVLYYDAASKSLTTLDGRETAPKAVTEDLFLNADGTSIDFWDAVLSGKSIGVPGTPKLLEDLHKRFGRKSWSELFEEPIKLSTEGFKVSDRLSQLIEVDRGKLDQHLSSRQYFYDENLNPRKSGNVLKNPDYAQTLEAFRDKGASIFYKGPTGREIVSSARAVGSDLVLSDLAAYEVIERSPVCAEFSELFKDPKKICSMAEPSSGGLTLLQIFKFMEHSSSSSQTLSYLEGSRLAFADRNAFIADPVYLDQTPLKDYLLNEAYLKDRAGLIGNKARSEIKAGNPFDQQYAPQAQDRENGTSHISIIDSYGNVLSMTTTIENAFGSRIMVGGFLLNNEMTDFAFVPEIEGQKVANRVGGGKRPRSSMAPAIVFNAAGEAELVIGSAGGSRIIGYVAHKILQTYFTDLELDQVLATPHLLSRGDYIELEETSSLDPEIFKNLGYEDVRQGSQTSGLTAILAKDGLLSGAADPRRNGLALGK